MKNHLHRALYSLLKVLREKYKTIDETGIMRSRLGKIGEEIGDIKKRIRECQREYALDKRIESL